VLNKFLAQAYARNSASCLLQNLSASLKAALFLYMVTYSRPHLGFPHWLQYTRCVCCICVRSVCFF